MRSTMMQKTAKYLLAVVPLLCLSVLPLAAQSHQDQSQQSGDSVADAARKAREQKKEAPKPKKVYTNEDVSHAAAAASSTAPASSDAAAPGAAAPGAAAQPTDPAAPNSGNASKEEDTWRKRFKDQREKIALAEKELDILQRELEKAQVQYYPDPQKALTEQYTRKDISDKTAKIDAKKQEIAQLKQQFSDMEDELRKSGGDPGWSR